LLERLQLFRSVGQFDAVSDGARIALAPLTLGFAENGRGKTTLAAILRSLSTNDPLPIMERTRLGAANAPHVVIDTGGGQTAVFQNGAWNRAVADISVFDDEFINENVYSGLVVGSDHRQNLHELILGSQGVALSRALQEAIAGAEVAQRALRQATDAITPAIRGQLTVEAFCALPARDDLDQAIEESEKQLNAANDAHSVAETRPFEPLPLAAFDEAAVGALLGRTLADVDAAALAKVQEHLARIGEGGESWVSDGIPRVYRKDAADHCPFCDRALAGSEMMGHYRAYFSAEYAALKSDIETIDAAITVAHSGDAQAGFLRRIGQLTQRIEFWARFVTLPDLNLDPGNFIAAWTEARNEILALVRRKERAPLEPVAVPQTAIDALAAYERARAEMEEISRKLQEANPAIALAKEQAAAANVATIQASLNELKAAKTRHIEGNAALCATFDTARQEKATADAARDAARASLDAHRATVFPAYQTAINLYLRRFNAGFSIEEVTSTNIASGSSCTYNVLINSHAIAVSGARVAAGQPSFKTALSAGDRNTLALAFFFASLDQDPNKANKIVVIDDPITSLDDGRALATVHEMRRLVDQVAQVIVLSHNKPFLCNVWEGMDANRRATLEVARDGSGSTIRAWDVSRDCITEHDKRHQLLTEYVASNTQNSREVATAIRPHLEAFLRVSFPAEYQPGRLLGPFRGICQQRIGQPNQLLDQADVTELDEITDYANRFHHDTNAGYLAAVVNDAEVLTFVRRALAFVRR